MDCIGDGMGIYHKKLYIRRGGAVIGHNLYTSLSEAGGNALCLRDGGNVLYAALGSTGDANASPLRVRKGSAVYAVLQAVAVAPPPTPPTPPPTPPVTGPTPPTRGSNIQVLSDCDYFTVPAGCRKILFAPVSVSGYWWRTETVRLEWYATSKCVVIDLPWDGAQVRIVNPVANNPYGKDRVKQQTSSTGKAFVQLRDVVYMYPPGHPPHNGEQTTCNVWSGMEINPQSYSESQWNHVKVLYAVYWGADINGLSN